MTYEAISNVVRHAHANKLELMAARFGDTFRIQITDDGRGFDQTEIATQTGLGLRNIQQRAELHGGAVEIASQPGSGTTVTINLSLNREA
jgi:signal transduction histidine kinase